MSQDSELDPSVRASEDLSLTIADEATAEQSREKRADIVEEQTADAITGLSGRTTLRLLVFTGNTSVFEEGSDVYERLLDIAPLFSEVHVVVLNKATEKVYEAVRLAPNLWVYPTNSRHTWAAIGNAKQITAEQFEFGGGFRADIVIALDAFLAGVVATQVAKKYDRPIQIHLTNNIFDSAYISTQPGSFYKKLMMWYVFRRGPHVRVSTRAIAKSFLLRYPKLEEKLEVVPQHIDIKHILEAKPSGTLNARFPQYNFFTLFVGPLTDESGALQALSAAKLLLRYPTICLLFLGEGELKGELEQRAEALKVKEQVIISPKDIDVIAAMKEAQILFFPDGKYADERILLQAAAAGLPIVTAASDFVDELFTDGESAFVCAPGDVNCMQEKANILLNENRYRTKFARNAREDVLERVEQDVDSYRLAFKESIERVVYSFETSEA